MIYIVSLLALGFAGISLLLLYLGVSHLARSWRASRSWLRVQGQVVDIETRRQVTTGASKYTSADSPHGFSANALRQEIIHVPIYEYRAPDGSTARVVSKAISNEPGTYRIGDQAELWIDPMGLEEPLVNIRSGIWLLPFGFFIASLIAALSAIVTGYMVMQKLDISPAYLACVRSASGV